MSAAVRRIAAAGALALVVATGGAHAADYLADPDHSRLGFVGRQAGADFHGRFKNFSAKIVFDPARLDASRFDVVVDMRSATTAETQRDNMLLGADFFAIARFPEAHFVADRFTKSVGGRYVAQGRLELRGVARDVPISFEWRDAGGGALLEGRAALKRLDFGIGQGDWQDTSWVGNDVVVEFSLRLQAAPRGA